MMSVRRHLAVNLGAYSSRSIVGTQENERSILKTINWFWNALIEISGRFYRHFIHFFRHILNWCERVGRPHSPNGTMMEMTAMILNERFKTI
ncbi:MAG: hypothetical protein AB7E95_09680 [Kiritimatiellales bacterium]